jgi:hypothetical protein
MEAQMESFCIPHPFLRHQLPVITSSMPDNTVAGTLLNDCHACLVNPDELEDFCTSSLPPVAKTVSHGATNL